MKRYLKRNRKTCILLLSCMLFLVGAGIFQNVLDSKKFEDVPVVSVETKEKKSREKEKMISPVDQNVKIVKRFYDTSLSDEEAQKALVYFEGVYRPNDGIDYSLGDQDFKVYASTSGEVIRKENDSLLGWIVSIENETGMIVTYQSVDQVKVEKGQKVKQGDCIAMAGQNVYQSSLKKHLHFIVSMNHNSVNPEKYLNKELENLKES